MQSNTPRYTQEQLAAFRKALLSILNNGPIYESYGLCMNLDSAKADGYAFVSNEARDWPHALRREDGNLCDWFVPRDRACGLWEGANMKMRQTLIQYLLGRVAHHEAMLRGGVALAG